MKWYIQFRSGENERREMEREQNIGGEVIEITRELRKLKKKEFRRV